MVSAGLSRAIGKIIIASVLLVAGINVGNVVASEKLSPNVLSALLLIMGSTVDSDDDGVSDLDDDFPDNPNETRDTDGDGVGDNADEFPSDPDESRDNDGDGLGDNADPDDDNDGIPDVSDPEPFYPHYFYGTSTYFSEPFGGAVVNDNGELIVPASAEAFAGFANSDTYHYPMLFTWGGRIYLDASVPSGGSADLRFRLERLPYDESDPSATEPSYETETITVSGAGRRTYLIDIPPLGDTTFESLILYIDTRDIAVDVGYPYFEAAEEPIFAKLDGAFAGFIAEGDYFEFPAEAEDYAGVANTNLAFYPIYLPGGGSLSFMAEVPNEGPDTTLYFRFENAPYPDNTSYFDSESIVVSGGPSRYTIALPAKGWDESYNSFLMYLLERDQGVKVWDVSIDVQYDIDSDGDGVFDNYDAFPDDPAASIDSDYDGMPDDWNPNATDEQIANSSLIVDDDDDNDGIPDADDPNPLVPDDGLAFLADFSGPFNGAVVEAPFTYRVPSDASADAGFANVNHDLYPFIFSSGGRISFQAWVPSGETADVHFRFEKAPYPDTEPSFSTEPVTISGSEPALYTVAIPPQGMDSFQSLILYIETRDVSVVIDGALVEDSPTPTLAIMSDAFGGFVADGPFFYYPPTAEANAGVANENPLLYPLSFPEGGDITFVAAPSGGPTSSSEQDSVSIYFRFENAPFPDNDSAFDTAPVVVYGPPTEYSVSIPPQAADQTYSSFLMFIEGVDQGVVAWDINVNMTSDSSDSDGDGVLDSEDAFPDDPAASIDTDNDGLPDDWNTSATDAQIAESTLIVDNDDDNDGVEDALDPDPTDPNIRGTALSGKVIMETMVTLDGDTNNVDNGYTPNDSAGSPTPDLERLQKIGDAQVVLGYLAYPNVGPVGQVRASGDTEDYYVLTADAGTVIDLHIGDPENADIDLWLYTPDGAYVTDSSSGYLSDFVTLQETGTYIVNAHLHRGHGSYALLISEPVTAPQDNDQPGVTGSKERLAASTPMSSLATDSDVGTVYVLLIDAETGVVESVASTNATSNYEYNFVLPRLGHYYLIAGTDNDNDQSICDADDICGVYGSTGAEVPSINLSGAQSDLDIVLAPELGIGPLRFLSPPTSD